VCPQRMKRRDESFRPTIPTRDLVAYVLGITPDQPGFTRVRVAPRSGPLHEIAGAVPTPHGLVEVRITGTEAEINSPVPAVDGGHRLGRPGGINQAAASVG
jgi:Bacterial alpha-L-rhamnosidase C-terminal domain